MARTEDGEMELVLGNKQLLSVLFILVVLLGVFFTMGYIVGRNNPSDEKVRIAAARAQSAIAGKLPPVTIDPSTLPVTNKPSPTAAEPPVASAGPVTVEPEKKKETPKTAEPEPKKEEPKREAKREEPKPEPARTAPAEAAGGLFQATPNAGLYLQVAAIDKPGASGMAEAYRKQGFSAQITSSSSPTLFRVIIGPLKNNDDVAATKERLKKLGVEGAILRKF